MVQFPVAESSNTINKLSQSRAGAETDFPPANEACVAVILAAGRGTRMGKITETIPKPLVPVLGKPALERVITSLAEAGIKRFVLVTGYLSEQVEQAVEKLRVNYEISCVHQDEQLGTAHAMRLTRTAVAGAPILLAFADIMTAAANYKSLLSRFVNENCSVVGGIRNVGDPYKAAAVYMDDDWNILRIIEKPGPGTSTTPWAHAGMYCFSNQVYEYIERITPSARGEYEITDAVSMMISDGLRCKAQPLSGYWKDLATMDDVREAEQLMQPTC